MTTDRPADKTETDPPTVIQNILYYVRERPFSRTRTSHPFRTRWTRIWRSGKSYREGAVIRSLDKYLFDRRSVYTVTFTHVCDFRRRTIRREPTVIYGNGERRPRSVYSGLVPNSAQMRRDERNVSPIAAHAIHNCIPPAWSVHDQRCAITAHRSNTDDSFQRKNYHFSATSDKRRKRTSHS